MRGLPHLPHALLDPVRGSPAGRPRGPEPVRPGWRSALRRVSTERSTGWRSAAGMRHGVGAGDGRAAFLATLSNDLRRRRSRRFGCGSRAICPRECPRSRCMVGHAGRHRGPDRARCSRALAVRLPWRSGGTGSGLTGDRVPAASRVRFVAGLARGAAVGRRTLRHGCERIDRPSLSALLRLRSSVSAGVCAAGARRRRWPGPSALW